MNRFLRYHPLMEAVLAQLLRQHESIARVLRGVLDGMTEEQFARAPAAMAPPIGWHLWHIARWGDRFQATLANRDAPVEIWTSEGMAQAFGFSPDDLGVLQLGMGMDATKAQQLPAAIGKQPFEVYLQRVLDALQAAVTHIEPDDLLAPHESIREYAIVDGIARYAPAQESTLLADIMFHLTHSSRHLGSVEALRGL